MTEVLWTERKILTEHDEAEALFHGYIDGVWRLQLTAMKCDGHPVATTSRVGGELPSVEELHEGLRHVALHYGLDMGWLSWECSKDRSTSLHMFVCRAHGPEVCDHHPDEVEAWHPGALVFEGSERPGKAS